MATPNAQALGRQSRLIIFNTVHEKDHAFSGNQHLTDQSLLGALIPQLLTWDWQISVQRVKKHIVQNHSSSFARKERPADPKEQPTFWFKKKRVIGASTWMRLKKEESTLCFLLAGCNRYDDLGDFPGISEEVGETEVIQGIHK